MSEESTTPDLAERWRQTFEVLARRDFDALMKFYAHDAVWDASPLGIGTFEGRVAIRRVFEEWIAPYEEYEADFEECRDLGDGVVFAVARQAARPAGSARSVQTGQQPSSPSGSMAWWSGGRSTTTSTRPVLSPNALPRSGGRRCRRTWTSCARSARRGSVATTARSSGRTLTSSTHTSADQPPAPGREWPGWQRAGTTS